MPGFGFGRRSPMPGRGRSRGSLKMRLVIAAIIAVIALVSYYAKTNVNPVTGEKQRVALSEKQEIALGLQARPEMIAQHKGMFADDRAQAHVDLIGERLLGGLDALLTDEGRDNPYRDNFEFHLLADPNTVNAFALPGGQVFLTFALYRQLETEGQVAGVIGHEIGHVLARHGAQRLAKQQLTKGLAGAAGVAGGDASSAQMAAMIGNLVNMKYGREDELESDTWGVKLCAAAGYDPRAMIGVMEVLERASGGGGQPEIFSTHPKPANRVGYIEDVIAQQFPNGLPPNLEP